ncbi:hypothetical protein OMP38_26405 [Cohnella ginsengisoli]|uniref:Uncharacterized protein n=1 Tax=Cohnella ginsengisoli TaxID=425004 RepID=A0A9X4KL88_9BACL|nr:hypothetical protein [Cohnella ginsengisoli]MDG0793960.1 hypothetical protein [Cohnella ginsengisoli]
MSNDQPMDKQNSTFKKFIADNTEAIRKHSNMQPKSIRPDDEWAEEHEWDEMHNELYRSEVKEFMESLLRSRSEDSKEKAKQAHKILKRARRRKHDNHADGIGNVNQIGISEEKE